MDSVTSLGLTKLDDIFPIFLVCLLLFLGPGAGGEINLAGIGGPGEGVNLFLSLGDRERLAAIQ